MTLVVVELRPEAAYIIADTMSILHGPGRIPMSHVIDPVGKHRIEDGNMICDEGDRVAFRSHSQDFWKVRFCPGETDAFAFAGSRNIQGPFLGITSETSVGADEQIWRFFSAHSHIETGPTVPPGEYDSIEGMHVYEVCDRLVATTFSASVLELSRRCKRSSRDEARYVAIGSGVGSMEKLLQCPEGPQPWSSYVACSPTTQERFRFWCSVFLSVSREIDDVGPEIFLWTKPLGGRFVVSGPCSAEPSLYTTNGLST